MHRRKYLTATAGAAVGIASLGRRSTRSTPPPIIVTLIADSGERRYESKKETKIQTTDADLTPAGSIDGTVGGPISDHPDRATGDRYRSELYWAPQKRFEPSTWIAAGSLGPDPREDGLAGRIYFNQDNFWVNDHALYHERGHNLGYRHHDGGLMNPEMPDVHEPGIDETTRTIQQHTAGLHALDWTDRLEALRAAVDAWRPGYISTSDLLYCFEQYRERAEHVDIYSTGELRSIVNDGGFDNSIYSGGVYRSANTTRDGTMAWR